MNRIVINCGEGRGKSSSAIGLVTRALAHNQKVLAIQFFKPKCDVSLTYLKQIAQDNLTIINCGNWYFLENPKDEYREEFRKILDTATEKIDKENFDFILLDEVNFATYFNLLTPSELIDFINHFDNKTFILTGRYVAKEIANLADTISEIKNIKHGFDMGIKATKGVEF